MFAPDLIIFRKSTLIGVASLVLAGVGFSAESNQVENVEITKPEASDKNRSKLFRPYLPSNPLSDSTKFTPSIAPTVPRRNIPSSSKRDEELLDRRRNWIFARPEDADKTESIEDAFGVSGMFDRQRSKGVVNQFLTEDRDRGPAMPEEKELNPFRIEPDFKANNDPQGRSDRLSQGILSDPSRAGRISGFSAEQSKLAEMWHDQANSFRMREDRETRMKDFQNLFRPQNNEATGGNGLNVLGQNNLAAPAASASRSTLDRFNPAASTSTKDRFGTLSRRAPVARGLEQPDVNTRLFGLPATTPPRVENKKNERPPAVLPIPKRKL